MTFNRATQFNAGFSLTEMVLIFSIIGILTTIALSSFDSSRTSARDIKRLTEARELEKALEFTYSETGTYPVSEWTCSSDVDWLEGTNALAVSLSKYLKKLPVDPVNERGYAYDGALNYCYYSNGFGGSGDWYILTIPQEHENRYYDINDGVVACDGTFFDFDANNGHILTIGGNCVQ